MKKNQKGFGVVEILIILFIVVGIVVAVWYVYRSNQASRTSAPNTNQSELNQESTKPTTDKAIAITKNFIKGMQIEDKDTVDSLTSASFKTALKSESGTVSFYDTCIEGGTGVDSCLASFKAFDLSKVTVDVIDSSEEAGKEGKTVTLHANSTLQGKLVNIGYNFHLSPMGDSWQINDLQESQGSPN